MSDLHTTRRVVQWATGTVGVHAVPAIARHPDLDLVGLWVHSADKVGRDAGEICGGEPLGVTATDDAGALLDLEPDCVCYTAHSDVRPGEVVDDLATMLRRGVNVVNTSFVPLLHPRTAGFEQTLADACREGGASIYTSGIDPGYSNTTAVIAAMAMCSEVRSARIMEIVNYATWDNPFTLFEVMGFGKSDPGESLLLSPGSLRMAWGPVCGLLAESVGVELDEIVEWHEVITADEDVGIAAGTVPAGTISGMHFEIRGMVDGVARFVVEHVTRLRDDDAPGWPEGSGYRIVIEGEPSFRIDIGLSSEHGDHNHAGCVATAMHVVNAIPVVCDADPGIQTALTLPLYSARPSWVTRPPR